MTVQTLQNDLIYCFCPAYALGDDPQQIRAAFDGMADYIPTAILALTIENGKRLVALGIVVLEKKIVQQAIGATIVSPIWL